MKVSVYEVQHLGFLWPKQSPKGEERGKKGGGGGICVTVNGDRGSVRQKRPSLSMGFYERRDEPRSSL